MPNRGEGGRQQHNPTQLPCPAPGCRRWFKNASGRTHHFHSHHQAQAAAAHPQQGSPTLVPADHTASVGDVPTVEGSLGQDSQPSTPPHSRGRSGPPPFDSRDSQPSTPPHSHGQSGSPPFDSLGQSQILYPLPSSHSHGQPLDSPVQSLRFHPSTPEHSPPPSPQYSPRPILVKPVSRVYHPLINGKLLMMYLYLIGLTHFPGQPCDEEGNFLPPDTPPPPRNTSDPDDWTPYQNWVEFETAEFLYCRTQMSASNINTLLDLWATTLLEHDAVPPFANHSDLYNTIDSMPLGDVPWQHFSLQYNGDIPDDDVPQWMSSEYEVWFRDPCLIVQNMVSNPNFKNNFNTAPVQIFDYHGSCEYQNFMSGDWVWEEAVHFYATLSPFIPLTST